MSRKLEVYFKEFIRNFTPYKNHWCYEDGVILKGALDLLEATQDVFFQDFVQNYLAEFVDARGNLKGYDPNEYNIDHLNAGKILFWAYERTSDERYRLAIEKQMDQLRTHPRTRTTNFWHKLRYPHQVWLDGLYMALPFFAEYENKFNRHRHYEDIFNQFKKVREILRNPHTGLYHHGFDESRESFWCDKTTGISSHCWLRAQGWLLMALIDTIQHVDETIFEYYKGLIDLFIEASEDFLPYQDRKTGLWRQVVSSENRTDENYLEVSGTAMAAYAFLKGVRLNLLPDSYKTSALKALKGIEERYGYEDEEGYHIGGICEVAGLGEFEGVSRDGSFEYYVSEKIVADEAKGIGPLMMAYAEYLLSGGESNEI